MAKVRLLVLISKRGGERGIGDRLTEPQLVAQFRLFDHWAKRESHQVCQGGSFVRDANRRFVAVEDPDMLRFLTGNGADDVMPVIHDFTRLLDFRRDDVAAHLGRLIGICPRLFSIVDDRSLAEIPKAVFIARLSAGKFNSQIHSQRVRAGLARRDGKGPTKRATRRGAAMKKVIADRRAAQLSSEIEDIRADLPPEEQGNMAAIARALNAKGVPTPSGRGSWQGTTVGRMSIGAQT